MNIRCDICGGELVMLAGGKGAACKSCGMEHSVERVREMLGMVPESAPEKEIRVKAEPAVQPAEIEKAEKTCECEKKLTESNESDFVMKKGIFGSKFVGYKGDAERVVFPEKISEVSGEGYFSGHDEIVELVFTDGISATEGREFSNCKNLKKIVCYGSMLLAESTFEGCDNLEEVYVKPGVTGILQIGEGAFAGCRKLKVFSVDENFEMEINSRAFKDCTSLEKFVFPLYIEAFAGTGIKPSAFEGCENLREIVIPKETESIHKHAFANCVNLKRITYHDGSDFDGAGVAIHPKAFENSLWQPKEAGVCPSCSKTLKCAKTDGLETMSCSCGFVSSEY